VETFLVNPGSVSRKDFDKACQDKVSHLSKRSTYRSDKALGSVAIISSLRGKMEKQFNRMMESPGGTTAKGGEEYI